MAEAEQKLKSSGSLFSIWKNTFIYKHMMNEFPLSEDLKSVPIPVRAVFGRQDSLAPYQKQLPFLQNLVEFSYKIVDHSGHSLPWTHQDLVLKEIDHFLIG